MNAHEEIIKSNKKYGWKTKIKRIFTFNKDTNYFETSLIDCLLLDDLVEPHDVSFSKDGYKLFSSESTDSCYKMSQKVLAKFNVDIYKIITDDSEVLYLLRPKDKETTMYLSMAV